MNSFQFIYRQRLAIAGDEWQQLAIDEGASLQKCKGVYQIVHGPMNDLICLYRSNDNTDDGP